LNFGKHSKKNKNIKSKKQKLLNNIIMLLALVIFIFSTYQLIKWLQSNKKNKSIMEDILADVVITEITDESNVEIINPEEAPTDLANDYWEFIKVPFTNVEFSNLLNRNSDTVAWLQVNGTNINYPVVQTSNNDYYLAHAFDNSYNSSGWIFADYRNNIVNLNRNTIIYGHNMLNNSMFGTLPDVLKSNWYENSDNHLVKMSTPTENTVWQVFAVYEIPAIDEAYHLNTNFVTDNLYIEFLEIIKSRSKYNFNVQLTKQDKVITLSTCANNTNNRVILHAKLIKRELK